MLFVKPVFFALTWIAITGWALAQDKPKFLSSEQLREAVHPGYMSSTGKRQECLGRLVFDLERQMEWGVNAPSIYGDKYRFTLDMWEKDETVKYGSIKIMVSAPAERSDIDRMLRDPAADKGIAIREKRNKIKLHKSMLEELREQKNPEDPEGIRKEIVRLKDDIKRDEADIIAIEKDSHPIDLGLPDALGYQAGSTLYAYLYRDGKAYQFMSSYNEDDPSYTQREKAFFDLIKRFKVRKLYEIPKEIGVCIPYGFLPDDGKEPFFTRVSIRYADRPNVIYTIGTGVVGTDYQKHPEAAAMQAMMRADVGRMGGPANDEVERRLLKRIEAHPVKIGALTAMQGAIALNVAAPGKPAIPNYSAYTGYPGWEGSQVLPFITLTMRSFTREQEPTLKTDPPPFEESMGRLNALIKTVRLRPTTTVMPELVRISSQ